MNTKETQLQEMLTQLRTRLLVMFAAVDIAMNESCDALQNSNKGKARAVIDGDKVINDKENEIDELALSILIRNQPVAHDLRLVVGALRMVGELERIGDEAVGIAFRVLDIEDKVPPVVINAVAPLIEKAQSLFQAANALFKNATSDNVFSICEQKNDISKLELEALHQIMDKLGKLPEENCGSDEFCSLSQGILISRSLNRICGRSINLAEQVYFIENGINIKHKKRNQCTTAI